MGSARVNITAAVRELDDGEDEEEYNAAAAPAYFKIVKFKSCCTCKAIRDRILI